MSILLFSWVGSRLNYSKLVICLAISYCCSPCTHVRLSAHMTIPIVGYFCEVYECDCCYWLVCTNDWSTREPRYYLMRLFTDVPMMAQNTHQPPMQPMMGNQMGVMSPQHQQRMGQMGTTQQPNMMMGGGGAMAAPMIGKCMTIYVMPLNFSVIGYSKISLCTNMLTEFIPSLLSSP